MHITVNGESRTLQGAFTLEQLLAELELDARQVAIERNQAIVPRSNYAETALSEGDRIEIVRFIGGG